jgi:hypothetical protein
MRERAAAPLGRGARGLRPDLRRNPAQGPRERERARVSRRGPFSFPAVSPVSREGPGLQGVQVRLLEMIGSASVQSYASAGLALVTRTQNM